MNLDNQVISWSRTYGFSSIYDLFIYIYCVCIHYYAISYIQVLVSSALLPQLCYPDGFFISDDSFFPKWFLDYRSFSLEVIWGQSPLKSRLNIFRDPTVAASS